MSTEPNSSTQNANDASLPQSNQTPAPSSVGGPVVVENIPSASLENPTVSDSVVTEAPTAQVDKTAEIVQNGLVDNSTTENIVDSLSEPASNSTETAPPSEEDPLAYYFKNADKDDSPKEKSEVSTPATPVAPVDQSSQSPAIQSQPNSSADEKIKKLKENPIIAAQKKARRNNIIKWVVVAVNFLLIGGLMFYYFFPNGLSGPKIPNQINTTK